MAMTKKNPSTVVLLTHTNITLYALCFWIQVGTLPYLTKKLDVNPVTFGYLQTTFAVVQLLGGPIFGRFGDLFGNRIALAIAFTSAFLSYFLLGVANTVFVIFLSRLPSVFMHAMQGAQMVITDITESKSRSDALGKLGLSYGVGMVLGPVIGGWCTTYASEQVAAFVAALGSLLSIGLVLTFVPQTTKTVHMSEEKEDDSDKKKSSNKLIDIDLFLSLVWKNPVARYLLFIKTVSGLPIGVLHSMFSMVALNHFKLSAAVNGYVLSYIGVVSMITQGLLIGRLTKYGFNDWTLINGSVACLCLSYGALALFVNDLISFCIALLPMVVAGAVFSTVVQAMLTRTVNANDTGSIIGISMSVHSLIRSVSPTIGGYIFQYYGFESFGILGVLCNGLLLVYIAIYDKPKTK
ncbi:solute carrier family 22 member 18-like [Clavelina lepadiformis]|uniref:Major facilitator superfamily (MFS) profile domain-containing protein n=1 Tax=Clavelina lepadiformis TaxID=159417 RepID=A0ABP0FL74_CLALP